VIQVQDLTRYYGLRSAIEGVTFEVQSGEILGFLGPNAAGKTTTMRILTCFMPASSGMAKVAGFDVRSHSMEVRRRIGYLPENPPLYPEMSVTSYLDFVAKIKGVDRRERNKRIAEVMDRTAISNVGNSVIRKLSKGYKQRVGLAQALVHNPEVLILDEPTIGLDPKQIIEVRELIRDLAGKHTVILSTHILPEVSATCQRVVIINKGKVVAEDTPKNLTAKVRSANRLLVEVGGPKDQVQKKLASVTGVKKVSIDGLAGESCRYNIDCELNHDVRPALAQAIVQNGWGLLELRSRDANLEDVFLQLTTTE
jgi:ABC-2 type transport system ATP-binding protein